jgi:hypothetical protein
MRLVSVGRVGALGTNQGGARVVRCGGALRLLVEVHLRAAESRQRELMPGRRLSRYTGARKASTVTAPRSARQRSTWG